MPRVRTWCCGLLLALAAVIPASAQTVQAGGTQGTSAASETRPSLPTFYGDTGLWFVPTAETLPRGGWSTSVYRANFDRRQGLTDISQIGVTGGFGVTDRLELFGSWRLVRIDRDVIPTFVPAEPNFGGVSHEYPYLRRGWSKTLGGPVIVGAKWNLISESRDEAMSLATRFMVKFPSGSTWASTNDWDAHLDLVASREVAEQVELTATAGGVLRGDPDEFRVSDGIKWGVGTSFPSRSPFRVLFEWEGEWVIKDNTQVFAPPYVAEDFSVAPIFSRIHDTAHVKVGAVFQARNGWFAHGGLNWSSGTGDHTIAGRAINHNDWGFDVRVGFHTGVKRYVPPPPPPPPPPPAAPAPPPPPPNRPPVFVGPIQCDPCTVEAGRSTALKSQATDPDNDPLTYRWTAPTGSFGTPNASNTTWTAPQQEGTVPLTVTADDGRGGRATNTLAIQVVRPAQKTFTFEDVHFDFDKYNLKPEALKILDEAIATLRDNPDLRVTIEGHCDSIGTTEYNLALGERRANAVRDYLVTRAIAAARMETVSYGEERPKADNTTEAGRALNRRAVLVVKIQ